MTLEQIEYFVAAVENGSFSRAAGQMFVSHSSVSRGVSVLEEELGVHLLIRGRQSLQCTEAGERFYRQGKALLQQAKALQDCVSEFRARQTLRLVSVGIYAPRFFGLCRDLQRTHPEIELLMEQSDQRTAVRKLLNGSVDMGVTFSYSLPEEEELNVQVLESGSFCALVSPLHELSGRAYLTGNDLAARNDLLGENPFRAERDRRRSAPSDVQSILLQIKAGSGITVLPEHAAAEFGHGCVRIPIQGDMTEYKLVLVWKKDDPSRALAEVIGYFRERLG